jgi:predicted transcriptional regulator
MARATPEEIKGLKHCRSLFNHLKLSVSRLSLWSNIPIQRDKTQRLLSLMFIGISQFDSYHLKSSGLKDFSTLSGKMYVKILISLYIEGKQAKTLIIKNLVFSHRVHEKYLKELFDNGFIEDVKVKRNHQINGVKVKFYQKELQLTAKGYDLVHFIFQILIPDELLEL